MDAATASALYQQVKLVLIEGSGLGKDALHIYAGMTVYLAVRLGLRRLAWMAWIAVVIAALVDEWLDIEGEYLRGRLAPEPGHWHDIWNTALWPGVLALAERRWPRPGAAPGSGKHAERSLEQA
ncbi:hypothetical protein [Sphingopyxis sp. PET50]|uniref:hypothetical protein n=1 Tax=Sphingopyxis sp. PET50 TaxID=2976533 RepID=UPI0021B038B8|nr:hypothetical protein [Sphingopyxis sp. PET50]